MSTDLVPVEPEHTSTFGMLVPAAELADKIARTEFVPGGLRGKPDAIAACVLFGHELGIPPMASLSKIHVIDGRPAMAAELMRATVLREGHEVWFEDTTTTRATVCARRKEWPEDRVTRVTWTMDDARKAGLDGRQNWRKYPRAMLKARASSEICRDVFPDVLGGISYSIEELDDGDVAPDEVPAGEQPAPATQTRKAPAKKAPARKATAKKAPARQSAPTGEDLPPLPGEEDPPAAAEKPLEVRRSQMLVIKAREAGLDDDQRHDLVAHVTGGRTTSTKEVDSGETDQLVSILDRVIAGETLDEVLDITDAVIVDEPPEETPAEDMPAPAADDSGDRPSDVDGWQKVMRTAGIRMAEVIRWAAEDAGTLNREAPGNLAQLLEDDELAELVWIRVVDRGDQ